MRKFLADNTNIHNAKELQWEQDALETSQSHAAGKAELAAAKDKLVVLSSRNAELESLALITNSSVQKKARVMRDEVSELHSKLNLVQKTRFDLQREVLDNRNTLKSREDEIRNRDATIVKLETKVREAGIRNDDQLALIVSKNTRIQVLASLIVDEDVKLVTSPPGKERASSKDPLPRKRSRERGRSRSPDSSRGDKRHRGDERRRNHRDYNLTARKSTGGYPNNHARGTSGQRSQDWDSAPSQPANWGASTTVSAPSAISDWDERHPDNQRTFPPPRRWTSEETVTFIDNFKNLLYKKSAHRDMVKAFREGIQKGGPVPHWLKCSDALMNK
jgi:hypothetical protein